MVSVPACRRYEGGSNGVALAIGRGGNGDIFYGKVLDRETLGIAKQGGTACRIDLNPADGFLIAVDGDVAGAAQQGLEGKFIHVERSHQLDGAALDRRIVLEPGQFSRLVDGVCTIAIGRLGDLLIPIDLVTVIDIFTVKTAVDHELEVHGLGNQAAHDVGAEVALHGQGFELKGIGGVVALAVHDGGHGDAVDVAALVVDEQVVHRQVLILLALDREFLAGECAGGQLYLDGVAGHAVEQVERGEHAIGDDDA